MPYNWSELRILSRLSQTMSLLFSYLNSVRNNSVIELCREQNIFMIPEKSNLKCFAIYFWLTSITHFVTLISPESSLFYASLK